jgi:dTDP-4-amino-4,6-dideoxygalactose transaminase
MTSARSQAHTIPDGLLRKYRFAEPLYVTRPDMPALTEYVAQLERIWDTAWLTNKGPLHEEFEQRLAERLDVDRISLCSNGTLALLLALQALEIGSGEVITTPFTFPATPHALYWNRVTPVFCDIEARTFNLDPDQIERHIGPETRAILPVHVFGNPCDTGRIQEIADRHNLPVIYDAAHALGVTASGRSLLESGDASILSFHATKHFTTAEGGAIVASTSELRSRIEHLRNFGIVDEETVIGPGINGKMSELSAALGLTQIAPFSAAIERRRELTLAYREHLGSVAGIRWIEDQPGVGHNYAYFPVLVDAAAYGRDRDELSDALRAFNIYARKYFYPLCSRIPAYADLPSASPATLPVAERIASQVLCLPLYGTLEKDDVEVVCSVIAALANPGGRT